MKYYSAICIADNEHLNCMFTVENPRTKKELLEIGREMASVYGGSCLKVTEIAYSKDDEKYYDHIDATEEAKEKKFVAWCKEHGYKVPPKQGRLIITDENENTLDEQPYFEKEKK